MRTVFRLVLSGSFVLLAVITRPLAAQQREEDELYQTIISTLAECRKSHEEAFSESALQELSKSLTNVKRYDEAKKLAEEKGDGYSDALYHFVRHQANRGSIAEAVRIANKGGDSYW